MAIRIDQATAKVFSADEFLLSTSYSLRDCVPAVAKLHSGVVSCQTTDKYLGVWDRDTPTLGRQATRKERKLIFGTDRPFDGQEALVLLCKKADELTLVSVSAFTKEACDKAFPKQVWWDSTYVKTCTAAWARRYREIFNHAAHIDDVWALLSNPQSENDSDRFGESSFTWPRSAGEVKKKVIDWNDVVAPWEDDPFADPEPAAASPQETERVTWDNLDAADREFEQLVREVAPQGYTDSSQVSGYIKRHGLHNKYRHISGMVRFRRGDDEWEFPGISPEWYAKLCQRLGLGNRNSGSYVTGFTSFADLNR